MLHLLHQHHVAPLLLPLLLLQVQLLEQTCLCLTLLLLLLRVQLAAGRWLLHVMRVLMAGPGAAAGALQRCRWCRCCCS
jgi:hypothetical protein